MGLLDAQTNKEYYEGNNLGSYQFVSVADIVNQFIVAYVGENKIIPKVNKLDVAFHAQRALQELSFDTFKSIKSQQIELPPTLVMSLPHDYVNYTSISTVDSSGIKHPLYSTKHTSNPFQIRQLENGDYFFGSEENIVLNGDFSGSIEDSWNLSKPGRSSAWSDRVPNNAGTKFYTTYINDTINVVNEELEFGQLWNSGYGIQGGSRAYGAWQRVDVTHTNTVTLQASGVSGAQQTDGGTLLCDYGVLRIGISSVDPGVGWTITNSFGNAVTVNANHTMPYNNSVPSPNQYAYNIDLGYVEWSDGTSSQKEIEDIDVSAHNEVWIYVQSFSPWTSDAITTVTNTYDHDNDVLTPEVTVPANGAPVMPLPQQSVNNTHQKNTIDNISLIDASASVMIQPPTENIKNSSTWNSYKSITPSENTNDNYEDDVYWPYDGERYGLEPSHAQINGNFYIDSRLGRIHFSSNISGKTVILDYISDSLGTNAEMQVHKFAEEAMYKWIAHAIISTSSYGQNLATRFKKEKFAAVRQAKLRLSSVKLEELTQILRGKSKQIKH